VDHGLICGGRKVEYYAWFSDTLVDTFIDTDTFG
jgi:hypothetical protein